MKPNLSATSEEPTLSTASVITKPKQQPGVDSGDNSVPVGFVTVLLLTEPSPAEPQTGPEEGPEESPEENPAETKLNSEDWLLPSPGSALPESGLVWVNGEDNDHAVSFAEVTADDPSFEEKRNHILVTCLRGESNFDYDGLSPLGAHCCKQLVIWLHTSDRKQWNLRGANLEGADLSGVDLYGVGLEWANLSGVNLEDANLRGANLYCANLKDVDLSGVDLYGADLNGANLEDVDLSGADLVCAKLIEANLRGADLRGASMGAANLTGANLEGADLSGASDVGRLSEDQRKQAAHTS